MIRSAMFRFVLTRRQAHERKKAATEEAHHQGRVSGEDGGVPPLRRQDRQRGLAGRTPQEIRDYIEITYGQQIGQQINTTASRMWRDVKEIDKDTETGLFRLPPNEKPVDAQSRQDTSTGLFNNPEHGREAGQGGGT